MEKPLFVITDPGTATLVTGAYAIVIDDRKTGKIIKVVPEKPDPTPWKMQLEVIAAGVELLRATEGVRAAEEMRVQAAKYLSSAVQAVTAEMAGRLTIREH